VSYLKIIGVCFLLLCLLPGCGPDTHGFIYEPVSGKVLVDGKPQAGLTVTFVSMSTEAHTGRPAMGETDADGGFRLVTIDGIPGAVSGAHRVSISSEIIDPKTQEVIRKETIPRRYNTRTELTFTVPEDGTDAANFEVDTKKR